MTPRYRRTWDAALLQREHPPRWSHPHKRAIAARLTPGDAQWAGSITVTQWHSAEAPEALAEPQPVEIVPRYFDYPDGPTWTVNFADPDVFAYYAGPLLAQDELQCLEVPALGSVREALLAEGLDVRTRGPDGPTPVLVSGVERRGALDTRPDLSRPRGLYGNRFAAAPIAEALSALEVFTPPPRVHILAIAAPYPASGAYTRAQLEDVVTTAYTGFAAAAAETGPGTTVCSGFWGCGAFGGNRLVMVTLQVLAARQAGVRLVLYTGDRDGAAEAGDALRLAREVQAPTLRRTLDALLGRGLRWGHSDGN